MDAKSRSDTSLARADSSEQVCLTNNNKNNNTNNNIAPSHY